MYPMVRMGLVALILATGAVWSKAHAADLVGSWRLVSWVEEETENKAVHTVFGDNPIGVITYTSDGRMSVFIANPSRKPPGGPRATDAEAAGLYRTMLAYSGAYSVDGNKVTHKIQSIVEPSVERSQSTAFCRGQRQSTHYQDAANRRSDKRQRERQYTHVGAD